MTTVKVEKEKNIQWSVLQSLKNTVDGLNRKKKFCIEGTEIYENTVKSLMRVRKIQCIFM